MRSWRIHPYRPPDEVRRMVDQHHDAALPIVHPQRVIAKMREEESRASRFSGWLADHIVGLAGTMVFFYFLCLMLGAWTLWQSALDRNNGFDPFPYAFLFFMLGGIMQSLFVPTVLVAANRATERDRIKDEADHRALSRLHDVNEEQLGILHDLAGTLLNDGGPPG